MLGTLGGNSRTLIHQHFKLFDEAIPALKIATKNNYLNIIITNQSHISHGRITIEEYNEALQKILMTFEKENVNITEVYTCPHARKDNCECKKPKTKFVEEAVKQYNLDLSKCFVVGDSGKNDVMLAKEAGTHSVLLLSGEGLPSLTKNRHHWSTTQPTFIAENTLDAVKKITTYF